MQFNKFVNPCLILYAGTHSGGLPRAYSWAGDIIIDINVELMSHLPPLNCGTHTHTTANKSMIPPHDKIGKSSEVGIQEMGYQNNTK